MSGFPLDYTVASGNFETPAIPGQLALRVAFHFPYSSHLFRLIRNVHALALFNLIPASIRLIGLYILQRDAHCLRTAFRCLRRQANPDRFPKSTRSLMLSRQTIAREQLRSFYPLSRLVARILAAPTSIPSMPSWIHTGSYCAISILLNLRISRISYHTSFYHKFPD